MKLLGRLLVSYGWAVDQAFAIPTADWILSREYRRKLPSVPS